MTAAPFQFPWQDFWPRSTQYGGRDELYREKERKREREKERKRERESRAAPCRGPCVLIGLLLAFSFAVPARATGPRPFITVLPVVASSSASPGEVRLLVEADAVEEIDIESVIQTESGPITSVETAGVSVVDPNTVFEADRASLPAGHAVAAKGDVVGLGLLHAMSFVPGVYAERVLVTLVVAGHDYPFDVSAYRHFEVTEEGTRPISIEEYSRRTLPLVTLPDGRQYVKGAGGPLHAISATRSTPDISGFDDN